MTDQPEDDVSDAEFEAFARKLDLADWQADSPPRGFAERVTRSVRQREAPPAQRGAGVRAADSPRRVRPRLLAGMALAALLASLALWFLPLRAPSGRQLSAERMEVPIGGRAVAVLEAGAEIAWEGSRVRQRRGDVFYRVDPGSEFRVETPSGAVQVLGTCFRVQVSSAEGGREGAAGATTIVNVFEGRVRASGGGDSRELGAGQSARLRASGIEDVSTGTGAAARAERALADLEDRARASATSADLESEVARLRELVGRVQSHRSRLEGDLKRAEERLAEAQGKPRERNEFDLTREDWVELAKSGTIKFAAPCRGEWAPSAEEVDALGFAPDDGAIISAAYRRSSARLWGVLRPLCADVLGDESVADIVGIGTCVHVIVDHEFKHHRAQAEEAMRQVAEIRAGLREEPPAEAQGPTLKAFLALTGETRRYEQELEADFGPEDAKRIVYGSGLCKSTFGGPGPREPEP